MSNISGRCVRISSSSLTPRHKQTSTAFERRHLYGSVIDTSVADLLIIDSSATSTGPRPWACSPMSKGRPRDCGTMERSSGHLGQEYQHIAGEPNGPSWFYTLPASRYLARIIGTTSPGLGDSWGTYNGTYNAAASCYTSYPLLCISLAPTRHTSTVAICREVTPAGYRVPSYRVRGLVCVVWVVRSPYQSSTYTFFRDEARWASYNKASKLKCSLGRSGH
ncbi:hypothetical protein GE09DRAFT_338698 [Coniochaeta sp. 2T2.1]|nr:hypothetical protein GE09DRAFT_338698 [Coniochaeta sp. 2T2.1]